MSLPASVPRTASIPGHLQISQVVFPPTSVNEKLEQRVEDTHILDLRWSRTVSGKASGLAESEVDTEARRDVKCTLPRSRRLSVSLMERFQVCK